MTLKRQLEVYRNARKSERLDVRVLDLAIIRVDRANREFWQFLVVTLGSLGLLAAAAFAQ